MYSDFATEDPPFSLLSDAERQRAVRAMDIHFYSAGDPIIEAGRESGFVFVVDKGLVEERDPAAAETDHAVAHYRDGEVFGSLAVLRGRARHHYVAMEDTLCHQLRGEVFRELVYSNTEFGQFFLQDLATKTKLVAQSGAYRDLVSFNMARVDESCMRLAVLVESGDSIRSVVETLRASQSDCALARRNGKYGILTRTNLLEALALSDHSLDDSVDSVATWNLITINEGEFLFEALIRMTRYGIERLVVMDGDTPVGLVEMSDILGFLSSHSHVIALRVEGSKDFAALAEASAGLVELARSLFAQRVSVRFIMDLLAELHRRIMAKNYRLLVSEEVHAKSCLLVLGSEGRGEQVMRTDQSNALVISPDLSWPQRQSQMEEFTHRTQKLGYPPSPRELVVSNPDWCLTTEQWQQRINDWAQAGTEDAILGISALLDAMPVAGNLALSEPLDVLLLKALPRQPDFWWQFVKPALEPGAPPPFSGSGSGSDIDVKHFGLFPIVHGARTLALELSLSASNTFRRLEGLKEAGAIEGGLADDLIEAFQVLNQLRLDQQLKRLEEKEATRVSAELANMVDTGSLAAGDVALLREAFRAVRAFAGLLAQRYRTA